MDSAQQIGLLLEQDELISLFDEYANQKSVSYFGFKSLCESRRLTAPGFNTFLRLLENSHTCFTEATDGSGQQIWIAVPDGAQINLGQQGDTPGGLDGGIQQCPNCGSAMDDANCMDCGYEQKAEAPTEPQGLDAMAGGDPTGGMGELNGMGDDMGGGMGDDLTGEAGVDGQAFGPELDNQAAPGVSTLGDEQSTGPEAAGPPDDMEGYDEMRAESIDSTLLKLVTEHFEGHASVVNYECDGKLIPAIETKDKVIYFAANGIKVQKR